MIRFCVWYESELVELHTCNTPKSRAVSHQLLTSTRYQDQSLCSPQIVRTVCDLRVSLETSRTLGISPSLVCGPRARPDTSYNSAHQKHRYIRRTFESRRWSIFVCIRVLYLYGRSRAVIRDHRVDDLHTTEGNTIPAEVDDLSIAVY